MLKSLKWSNDLVQSRECLNLNLKVVLPFLYQAIEFYVIKGKRNQLEHRVWFFFFKSSLPGLNQCIALREPPPPSQALFRLDI